MPLRGTRGTLNLPVRIHSPRSYCARRAAVAETSFGSIDRTAETKVRTERRLGEEECSHVNLQGSPGRVRPSLEEPATEGQDNGKGTHNPNMSLFSEESYDTGPGDRDSQDESGDTEEGADAPFAFYLADVVDTPFAVDRQRAWPDDAFLAQFPTISALSGRLTLAFPFGNVSGDATDEGDIYGRDDGDVRGGEEEVKGDAEELGELEVGPGDEDQGKNEDEDENQDRDQDRYRHHGNTKDEDKVTVEVFFVYLPYVHTLSFINGRFCLLLKAVSLHSSAQDLDLNVAIGDTPSEAAVALL
jgi:hypothetical protein